MGSDQRMENRRFHDVLVIMGPDTFDYLVPDAFFAAPTKSAPRESFKFAQTDAEVE
jgi:hypothetical protein